MTPSGSPIKPTEARAEYDKASAAYEAAAMSGDPDRIKAAYDPLIAAGERYARAMDRRIAPSFETVLSDWTQQVDPGGEVCRSIIEYANALPASSCACGGSLHRACGSS